MRSETIEAMGSGGLRLRVEFVWRHDRYAHVISIVEANGAVQPLLESIEGTPAEDWPASPPLQSLSVETLTDGRRVALLVGMAGGSHWSASIEAVLDKPELVFDLACRHSVPPTWLGSRYRRLSDVAKRLTIHGDGGTVVQEIEAVKIQPTGMTTSGGTTRWKLIVRLECTAY